MRPIIFIIAILMLSSCTIINTAGYMEDWDYNFNDGLNITDINDAFLITYHIKYAADTFDYWQTPEQTISWQQGDCEDHAILFMYLIYKYLDMDSCLIAINMGDSNHAVVRLKSTGEYYDPTFGYSWYLWYEADVQYSYNYGETMYCAENYHLGLSFLR